MKPDHLLAAVLLVGLLVAFEADDPRMYGLFVLVDVLDEVDDAALVAIHHRFGAVRALTQELDLEGGVVCQCLCRCRHFGFRVRGGGFLGGGLFSAAGGRCAALAVVVVHAERRHCLLGLFALLGEADLEAPVEEGHLP